MEFPLEEEGVYSFNDFVLPSPSPLGDEEEQISRPSSSKDRSVYGYERMTPKPPAYHSDATNHQIDHVKRPLSKGTRSHLMSPERSKVSCCRPQTGSDNASDTSQEIQPSLSSKMSNSRIFDSQNPSLSHIRADVNEGIDILNKPKLVNGGPHQSSERNSCSLDATKKGIWSESENKETSPISPEDRNFSENSKMEVLSKLSDETLVHNCQSNTENFDLKSSSSTSMDSFSERRVNGQEFGFLKDPTPSTINISMHAVPKKPRTTSAIYSNVVKQKPYRS
ncbi:uncharacterized protein LOC130054569 [Ostrea edulis]|uniref:uncharacterized protein LOC130054569 n=1 Tax=Ostrea edulis TaxID=37623 RepID=UPI0024AFA51C|nr:uncharacterized protein LOC130054569 [Ostrea edulis]